MVSLGSHKDYPPRVECFKQATSPSFPPYDPTGAVKNGGSCQNGGTMTSLLTNITGAVHSGAFSFLPQQELSTVTPFLPQPTAIMKSCPRWQHLPCLGENTAGSAVPRELSTAISTSSPASSEMGPQPKPAAAGKDFPP